uniref:spore coat protein n=1 Tax=uncultured Allobacillus sp. TaxID=1638025 RepID=UPI0025994C91|nr:spore coat protein [uncultured Allobacillus sp.]
MQQQQNPNSQMQNSSNLAANKSHGAHEIMDVHETLSTLTGTLEHYKMYQPNIQCEQLQSILSRQTQYLNQLYNTMVNTYQSGTRPPQPTTTYNFELSNDVTYGLSPSQPTQPQQSPQSLNEQNYSSYMMGHIKACATACTTSALEATNPVMRRVLQDSVPNLCEMAYELFLYQNDRSYYQVPQFDDQSMTQLLNSFTAIPNPQQH